MKELLERSDFKSELDYIDAICWEELDAEPVLVHMELLRIRYQLNSSEYLGLLIKLAIRELESPSLLDCCLIGRFRKIRFLIKNLEEILNFELNRINKN